MKPFRALISLLTAAGLAFAASTFTITADTSIVGAGQTVRISTHATMPGALAPAVDWTLAPLLPAAQSSGLENQPALNITAPPIRDCVHVAVTATAKTGEVQTVMVTFAPASVIVPAVCPQGSLVLSVVGFEQASAASSSGTQDFFFDFYQSYPLALKRSADATNAGQDGPPWRWWGDVRIASMPKAVSTPVLQFAGTLLQQVAKLPVNQLARSGEFRTGLERRIGSFEGHFLRNSGAAYERTSSGAFVYFGAQGALDGSTGNRAFQEYGVGFRLSTRFIDTRGRPLHAPAVIAASFGQNELISGGKRRGIVGTFEGFYPLPFGTKSAAFGTLYLFCRATLQLGSGSVGRDVYAVGVGVDAVELIKKVVSPQ